MGRGLRGRGELNYAHHQGENKVLYTVNHRNPLELKDHSQFAQYVRANIPVHTKGLVLVDAYPIEVLGGERAIVEVYSVEGLRGKHGLM